MVERTDLCWWVLSLVQSPVRAGVSWQEDEMGKPDGGWAR